MEQQLRLSAKVNQFNLTVYTPPSILSFSFVKPPKITTASRNYGLWVNQRVKIKVWKTSFDELGDDYEHDSSPIGDE